MGAPVPAVAAADDATAETLLSSLRTIADAERRRHASVYNYWLALRGDRHFPAIRDLDPLEISDAGRQSVLLEVVGTGEDADIRHLGSAIAAGVEVEKITDAPSPSLLSCIARNLPIVMATRDAFAFEDEFENADGKTRCWISLLPFSAKEDWVDFVYGFVTLDPPAGTEVEREQPEPEAELEPEQVEQASDEAPEAEPEPEQVDQPDAVGRQGEDEPGPAASDIEDAAASGSRAGFSARFFESLASVGGFYGRVAEVETGPWTAEVVEPAEPADAPANDVTEPIDSTAEGPLQTKLDEVRAKADEARLARLRSNAALCEGLSAAYDFALDAEQHAEEYLKLVEAQGLKIQLRSPMAPVVKLAFDGSCDDSTIARLETVLAWALKQDLPRGSLAEKIEAEGGLDAIAAGLNGKG